MPKLFCLHEITQPEDVIPFLAKQELHWRENYSAYELAQSWVRSNNIPAPVRDVLDSCADYHRAELIEGFFEREVDLQTPGRRSQTDLLAFVSVAVGYAIIAVEGKVDESFGPLVSEWRDGSPGKEKRLFALCNSLGLNAAHAAPLRYQLFHRSVSAIYEAQRYRCEHAMMLVHSFSPQQSSFADFVAFTAAIGAPVTATGQVSAEKICDGIKLRFAWCADKYCGKSS